MMVSHPVALMTGCLVFSYDRSGWLTGSMGQREQRRTTFVWEGFRLLQETTWQGKRTYLYYAEQPYTPVAAVTGRGESRKIWYYHTDVTGTVQEVSAADGTLVWAGYQAGFGENRGDISNSGAYFEQPLRLPGQYFDEETGLHYNLFRYYAPECGRFISQDPIGLRGGLNLYVYAPNPLSWIDPLGLTACSKNAKSLREGPQGTVVTVKSKQEAHDLLMEAFPDAQKVRGIGSQDAAGIRKKHKMEQFKKRDGTVRYRKDYPIDSNTGRVYGHDDPKGTGHGSLPHINIKRSDGTMVRIDIDGWFIY